MFRLLKYLAAFQAATGINLREFMKFAGEFVDLGGPPPLSQHVELRSWLRELVQILEEIAAETPTLLDDHAIEVVSSLLDNDPVWEVVYSSIVLIVDGDFFFGEAEETELSAKLTEALAGQDDDKVGMIDPLVIIAIIRVLVELFRQWRGMDAA